MSDDKKLPGLDGLRAIAVAMVLLFHQGALLMGWIGVQAFFVLSGYLITGLLVKAKSEPAASYFRNFYGRRALRIFPLYYAVIALFAIAKARGWLRGGLEGLPYAATYTYNLWFSTRATQFSMLLTHFWSLCVEEQFYLLWPLLIYVTPRARLKPLLTSLIAAGPAIRLLGAWYIERAGACHLPDPLVGLYGLTPTQLDAFAAGGLMALFPLGGSAYALLLSSLVWLVAGLALLVHGALPWTTLGYPIGLGPGYAYIWGYSLINCCSALLIDCLVHRKFLAVIFESRPLAYLGRISYGLYVVHYPMQELVSKALPHAPLAVQIATQAALSVAVASLSFQLWEKPFLRLKARWFASPPAKLSERLVG